MVKLYKQLFRNIKSWRMWRNLANKDDELAKHIVSQYGFIGFITIGF